MLKLRRNADSPPSTRTAPESLTLPHISRNILTEQSNDWVSRQTSTTCTELIPVRSILLHEKTPLTLKDTPLEESIPALDEIRKAGKTKYIGLSECSATTLRKANSSKTFSLTPMTIILTFPSVAKIDAVQAEYSAFETLHETDGLIDTARELGVAYVAYSPLGHGWLVDNCNYKTPDDFAPDDFRRTCQSPNAKDLAECDY